MQYPVDEAQRIIAGYGYIARVSAIGRCLIVYEGEEHSPGTWTEIGRCSIAADNTVSSNSLQQFS